MLFSDARQVGEVDREEREQTCDADAADRADDRARRLHVAAVDDELGTERDERADEERPQEDVRRREEDQRYESLGDQEDGEEQHEKSLEPRHAAEEDEDEREAEEQPQHAGQTVVVDDGIGAVLLAHEDVLALLRMDVKGRIVERAVDDARLLALVGSGFEADRHIIFLAARRELLHIVRALLDGENLCLARRRIVPLAARQVEKPVEGEGNEKAKGKECAQTARLWLDFHSGLLLSGAFLRLVFYRGQTVRSFTQTARGHTPKAPRCSALC